MPQGQPATLSNGEIMKLTTITIPYALEEVLGETLQKAGFYQGTLGGGEATWELHGELTRWNRVKLETAIAKAFLVAYPLEVEDIDDEGDSPG